MNEKRKKQRIEVMTFAAPECQWEWLDWKTEEARKADPVASRSDIIRAVIADAMKRDPLTKS